MGLLSTDDCDELLRSLGNGDSVTCAGVSVPCIVASADGGQIPDVSPGVPVEALGEVLVVTVRTGALPGLASGATVVIGAVTCRADHVARARNVALTNFLAYPA